jgi:hypothetical protein
MSGTAAVEQVLIDLISEVEGVTVGFRGSVTATAEDVTVAFHRSWTKGDMFTSDPKALGVHEDLFKSPGPAADPPASPEIGLESG